MRPAPTTRPSAEAPNIANSPLPPSIGIKTPGARRSPFQVPTPSFAPTMTSPTISGCATPPTPGQLPAPPVQQVEQIIPDEDPQRPVDLGDDDDDEGDGEGVGSEDLDEAEGDDEGDPNQVPAGPQLPEWLLSQFHVKLAECGPNFRDAHGLPPLYARSNTFWFPQPSTFFLLKHDNPSPQKLYNPRFFLWDPEPLCSNGIPCPTCRH